jgi:hypothetical protein
MNRLARVPADFQPAVPALQVNRQKILENRARGELAAEGKAKVRKPQSEISNERSAFA